MLSRPLLLIVEDNELTRRVMAAVLGTHRHLFAKSGKEAISTYKKRTPDISTQTPDIVLLDYWLPDMDGLEVLREIKKINPSAYVVMISANSDEDTINDAINQGAQGFIQKPFKRDNLNNVISYHIDQIH